MGENKVAFCCKPCLLLVQYLSHPGCSFLPKAPGLWLPPATLSSLHLLSDRPYPYVLLGLPASISLFQPTFITMASAILHNSQDPVTRCPEILGSSWLSSLEKEIPAILCHNPPSCHLHHVPCPPAAGEACCSLSISCTPVPLLLLFPPGPCPPLAHHTPFLVDVLNCPLKAQWKHQLVHEALASLPGQN